MEKKNIEIIDIKITRTFNTYLVTYLYNTEIKTSLISELNNSKRKINNNQPNGVDIFTHLKICLVSFFADSLPKDELIKIFKDSNYRNSIGKVTLWSEEGIFKLIINNVEEKIILER